MSATMSDSEKKSDPATMDVQEEVKLNSPAAEETHTPGVDCTDRDPNHINDHVKVNNTFTSCMFCFVYNKKYLRHNANTIPLRGLHTEDRFLSRFFFMAVCLSKLRLDLIAVHTCGVYSPTQ